MTREQKIAEARRLREQGLTLREIGERLGVALQTVHFWLSDPDGAKARARKDRYRGTCRTCGAQTDGSAGPGKAPTECLSCMAQLLERGCTCSTERVGDGCPLHKPGDNRGLRAFWEAGMPLAFPSEATCGKCGADGLMYPCVEQDAGELPAGEAPPPTLICPNCSTRAAESLLRFRVEFAGLHKLNGRSVFGIARPYPVKRMQDLLDSGTPEQRAECIDALRTAWLATEDGTDSTTDFELGDDGRRIMSGGRAPSYALALLFDYENFMRGEGTALVWEQAEAVAA